MIRIAQIWDSFRRLPLWVQVWVALILVPVNLVSLFFVTQPHGVTIAVLAVGGMMPNLWIMWRESGLSKAMSLPHVVIWTPLVLYLVVLLVRGDAWAFGIYLVVLFATDLISLVFDYADVWKWWRGDRSIA